MAKNIEKKYRFNVIDIILIVLILTCIAGVIVFTVLGKTKTMNQEIVQVEYTVKMVNIKTDFVDYLKLGEKAYNSSSGNEIGTITNIRTEKAKTYTATESGTVIDESDTFVNVYVTLTSNAVVAENGISTIDGNKILIGSSLFFRVSPFAHVAYVIAFDVNK